jgi:lipopolysaccharide transport system ATP-binding protein
MSEIAINVQHLGKQYRLGGKQASYSTFRETLVNAANVPLQWLKGERKKELNTFWALDDVSFEVNQGDAIGIIGRNGAGKSTLLKILSRITSPTRGRVDIYGRVGTLLEVGTGFHPELTGRENIYLNGAILGMSRVEIQRKFDEIVAFSEIERFLDTPVKHYSSGMYVRLAFAVAAHLEPEILVVDEVLAVGDAAFQKKCLGKMGDVAHEGRTVLFVSHNMGAVRSLCNKGIVLEEGKINEVGEINYCVDRYLDHNFISYGGEYQVEIDTSTEICFYRIRVQNNKREVTSIIEYNDGFQVEIDYVVTETIKDICFSLAILDNKNDQVILTRNVDAKMQFPYAMKKGKKTYSIKFPTRFLTPGKYYLQLELLQLHGKKFQSVQRVCGFDVIDTKSNHAALGFSWNCKVTLPLEWKTIEST